MVMWGVAAFLFVGAKVLTMLAVRSRVSPAGAFTYLFFWVGMDAREFFGSRKPGKMERVRIAPGVVKMFLGAMLLWGVAPKFKGLAAGWLGMSGMVLLLHFGVFHLLASFWQARGAWVQPIMNQPLRAMTLADFWGERWNRAFNELMYRFVFRPALNWAGVTGATLLVFMVSGLIHDLVISVPADGGYGLPTLYFLLQGLGLLVQRTETAKTRGWSDGARGRFLTAVVLIAPLPCLFHAQFIHQVILPFMKVIGAGPAQINGGLV